jgi:hypothetical protein
LWPFAEQTRRVQWIDSGHTPAVLACVLRVFADFELRTESLLITNTNGASPEYSGVDWRKEYIQFRLPPVRHMDYRALQI